MQLQITDTRTLTDEKPDVRNMEFNNTAVTIGGHSANTVQLPDTEVAAYHGMILPLGEEHWTYRSTDPQALTLINGEPVERRSRWTSRTGTSSRWAGSALKLSLDSVPELVLPEARNLEELARIKDFPLPPRSEVRRPEADISLSASRRAALVGFDANLRQAADLSQVMEHTLDLLLPELGARTAWVGNQARQHRPDRTPGRAERQRPLLRRASPLGDLSIPLPQPLPVRQHPSYRAEGYAVDAGGAVDEHVAGRWG